MTDADYIAALTAERDALKEHARELEDECETAQNDIAALKQQVNILKEREIPRRMPNPSEIDALTAQVARLQEALKQAIDLLDNMARRGIISPDENEHMAYYVPTTVMQHFSHALAETPAQSLSAVRNEVLNAAAKVIADFRDNDPYDDAWMRDERLLTMLEDRILAMKEADNEPDQESLHRAVRG